MAKDVFELNISKVILLGHLILLFPIKKLQHYIAAFFKEGDLNYFDAASNRSDALLQLTTFQNAAK